MLTAILVLTVLILLASCASLSLFVYVILQVAAMEETLSRKFQSLEKLALQFLAKP